MDMTRKGSKFEMDLDKPEDSTGLFAVLTNNPAMVSAEVFQKGQFIYAWFFSELQKLSSQHEVETQPPPQRKSKRKPK